MFSALLDFAVVILPFLVSLLGVHMSASLSRKEKTILIGFGILVSVLTLIQQQESRKGHGKEIKVQTDKIEQLRTELEGARVSGESAQAYLRGQLDSVNRTLGALLNNSDPKQQAALVRGMLSSRSTLKKDTLALCDEIEAWSKERTKKYPPPTVASPGKPTQKETDEQNDYWQKFNTEYYSRFAPRALSMLQQYGAKGIDVRMLEQSASYGYMPQNIVLELRAFADRLDDSGNLKP